MLSERRKAGSRKLTIEKGLCILRTKKPGLIGKATDIDDRSILKILIGID